MTTIKLNHLLNNPDGSIEIEWTQGSYVGSQIFLSPADLRAWLNPIATPEEGLKLLISQCQNADLTGIDLNAATNTTIEVDLARRNPIAVRGWSWWNKLIFRARNLMAT